MSFLPARADWTVARPKDLLAGLTVAVVALPLALRFGVASMTVLRYVPAPVVEGFTIGIAAVIALQHVPAALGVHARDQLRQSGVLPS